MDMFGDFVGNAMDSIGRMEDPMTSSLASALGLDGRAMGMGQGRPQEESKVIVPRDLLTAGAIETASYTFHPHPHKYHCLCTSI